MSDSATLSPEQLAIRERAFGLVNRLWDRPEFQKLAKEADPTLRTTAEIAEPYVAPIRDQLSVEQKARQQLEERVDGSLNGQKERDEDAKFRARIGDVQTKRKPTDDGVASVLELMKSRQIADPEAAAALWQEMQPKAKPTSGSSLAPGGMSPAEVMAGGRGPFGGSVISEESMKLLHTRPDDWMTQAAFEVFNETSEAA